MHLPGAGHVPSVRMFVVYPAASSFGCPGFLLRRTGMFQSPTSSMYHFCTAATDLHQVDMDLLPQMILSGFGPFSRGLAFSLNFPELQGVRISGIHHELQLQPTCILQNTDFRSKQGLGEQEILHRISIAMNV